jgi:nitroreductase
MMEKSLMDFFDVVRKRQSYRAGFRVEVIPREFLHKIVQAGLDAPSGKNAQTTEFVIIDAPTLIDEIHALHSHNTAMQQATAYIACIIDRVPEAIYEGHSFQVEDCAAAVENMLLAITALDYETVWIDGWLRVNSHTEHIGKLIRLAGDKIIRVLLPIGKASESYPQPQKKAFTERVWFNRYHYAVQD